MKPAPFALHRPDTLAEAAGLLAEDPDDSKVLAGGQSLVPLLNFRMARPDHVVDVGRIAALGEVRREPGGVAVGAMVRHSYAGRSAAVARDVPLVSAAIPHIAHPAVRNRGTVGGSLAHADPAAELPAVARALDAEFTAYSHRRGERTVPAAEFFRSHLVSALESDEILTEVRFRRCPPRTGAVFREVGRRQGDFALVGVAVQVTLVGAVIGDARVCFTGVSDIPHRCSAAEELLRGAEPGADLFAAAADTARADIDPVDDLHATGAYRRATAAALLEQALDEALRAAAATDQADTTAAPKGTT